MSKYVKNLISETIRRKLEGVDDAVLVDVIGMDSGATYQVRKRLREKNIQLLVIKNSLARRAAEGTRLAAAFDGLEGSAALCFGGEDFISLVKEITELDKSSGFEKFQAKGGVMDGEHLTPEKVKEISKWPNRQEQLSLLLGQILSPGANLSGALLGPGGALASQIEKKSKEDAE